MTTPTHITTSGGLISAAFIDNIREPSSRQRGVEPASFALGSAALTTRPWAEAPKSPAALKETIATACTARPLLRVDGTGGATVVSDTSYAVRRSSRLVEPYRDQELAGWSPNLVSIRPSAYPSTSSGHRSTDDLALNRVTPISESP